MRLRFRSRKARREKCPNYQKVIGPVPRELAHYQDEDRRHVGPRAAHQISVVRPTVAIAATDKYDWVVAVMTRL
jgi:hypothetical protein